MTLTQILSKLKSLVYSKTETDTLLGNKAASSHTHSDYVPKSGGNVITGTTFNRTINDSSVTWCGGTDWDGGASITLSGKDRTNDNGDVIIRAKDNSNVSDFVLRPNGTATWGNKNLAMYEDVIPRSGGSVISAESIGKTNNTSRIILCGGTDVNNGGSVTIYGKDSSTGDVTIQSNDGTNHHQLRLNSNGTATWDSKNLAMQEDTIPRSGGGVITGLSLARNVDNSELQLSGATHYMNGASVILYGKDFASLNGMFRIRAALSDSSYSELCGWPSGVLTWYTGTTTKSVAMYEDVVPRSGGAVMTGSEFYRNTRDSYLLFGGGIHGNDGAAIMACGPLYPYNAGGIQLGPRDGVIGNEMYLQPNGTWTWSGTAVQITSDQRLKQQIAEIDDKLLDAWEDVELVQFKYNDAVDQKGDTARLHTGYVVQQIDEACKSHGVDVSEYGLYCHEEYPEETEEVEVEQEDGTKIKERRVVREASEHYSLRYTETLVVECAFLRREVKRLSERLFKLEQPSTSEN